MFVSLVLNVREFEVSVPRSLLKVASTGEDSEVEACDWVLLVENWRGDEDRLIPGKPSVLILPSRPVGVGFGSTETTERMGNTRCGAEGPNSSKGDVMAACDEDVMVSFR